MHRIRERVSSSSVICAVVVCILANICTSRAYDVFIMTCTLYNLGHRYRINSTGDVYYDEEPKSKYGVTADSQKAYGELQDVCSLV